MRLRKVEENLLFRLAFTKFAASSCRYLVFIREFGVAGWGWQCGKAFTWRFGFDPFGTSQLLTISQRQSNSRCHGICLLYSFIIPYRNRGGYIVVIYIHIGVRSALLVSTNRAMRRPQKGETGNRYRFSRFFVLNNTYRRIGRTYRQN